jgi:hypothetical protein
MYGGKKKEFELMMYIMYLTPPKMKFPKLKLSLFKKKKKCVNA